MTYYKLKSRHITERDRRDLRERYRRFRMDEEVERRTQDSQPKENHIKQTSEVHMIMNETRVETEQEYDDRMEEESYLERLDAVHRAKNQLLQSIKELYLGDDADAKIQRCKSYVEHMNFLFQSVEMEYGDTLPNNVVRTIIEDVFKLSNRKGWEQ